MSRSGFIALAGRPNVGKSTLVNRIVGEGRAIVSEEAGTTRDRHFAATDWSGRHFWLVDTGGLTDDPNVPMDVEIRRQVLQAIDEADLLLLVVDAKAGLHPSDRRVLDLLRDAADTILFDAPPVVAVTDAAILASRVDGVLLVVDAGATRRDLARRARAQLEKVNARLLGVVLNNVPLDPQMYGYYAQR